MIGHLLRLSHVIIRTFLLIRVPLCFPIRKKSKPPAVPVTDKSVSLAERIRQENQQGGNEYDQSEYARAGAGGGADVPDGGPQRYAGTGAGEQTGGLGRGPAQSQKRSAGGGYQTTIGRQNRGKHLPQVSSRELGLENGTDAKTIRVVPQELWDAEMSAVAERIYNETGKQVEYVLGPIQIRGANNRPRNARGVFDGDRVIVQADHAKLSISQIADHEAYHVKASPEMAGQGLNQAIRQHIMETYTEEALTKVVSAYLDALDGVYGISEATTGEEYERLIWVVEEEVFADAYAGINSFGAHAEQFTDGINEKMDAVGLGKQPAQENGTKEATGPPAENRYSIDETSDNSYTNNGYDIGIVGSPKNMPKSSREWHTFNRSLANKTADMNDDETRFICISTADYAYFIEADGYMHCFVEKKIKISDRSKKLLDKWRTIYNGSNPNADKFDSWAEDIRTQRGRDDRDNVALGNRGEYESADRLSSGTQERDVSGGFTGGPEDLENLNSDELMPGSLVFDGKNGWEIGTDGSASSIRLSVDDSDYTPRSDAGIRQELEAEQRRWADLWLRERLGDEAADAYLQRKKDAAKAAEEQRIAKQKQQAAQQQRMVYERLPDLPAAHRSVSGSYSPPQLHD